MLMITHIIVKQDVLVHYSQILVYQNVYLYAKLQIYMQIQVLVINVLLHAIKVQQQNTVNFLQKNALINVLVIHIHFQIQINKLVCIIVQLVVIVMI